MTLPFPLPPWLPWWVPIVVVVPALLYVLLFLLVPFSVFGLKSRLDAIDARLDELQGEIRQLAPKPRPLAEEDAVETAYARRVATRPEPAPSRIPVAPAGRAADDPARRRPPPGPAREEPRLNWPR